MQKELLLYSYVFLSHCLKFARRMGNAPDLESNLKVNAFLIWATTYQICFLLNV